MASDITLQIGAQDQATAILEKIGKSTENLTRDMGRLATASEKSSNTINVALKGIAIAGAAIAGVKAVAGIAKAAFDAVSSSVDAFNVQQAAMEGMTQAQAEFASSLQVSTNVGDETTLKLMQLSEAMGATKETSDDVALSAIGLSKAFGIDQNEALKKVMQATSGNADALAELIPEIRNATTAEEKYALISEAAAGGLQRLQNEAGNTQGIMARASGAFGDLSEKIGELAAPIYDIVYTGLAVLAEQLQTALGPAIEYSKTLFASMPEIIATVSESMRAFAAVIGVYVESTIAVWSSFGQAVAGALGFAGDSTSSFSETVDSVARGIIGALTFMEVGFTRFGDVVQMAGMSVALHMEGIRADFEHALTVVMPQYVIWFAQNFHNIINDAMTAALTVFENFGKKVAESWTAIWDWLKGGMEGGVGGLAATLGETMGGSLLEGFEAKTQSLPEIAARQMTATELVLGNRLTSLGADIAGEFDRKYQERIKQLEKPISTKIEFSAPDMEELAKTQLGDMADQLFAKQNKGMKQASELAANESRLLSRGPQEDPLVKQQVDIARQQLDATQKMPEQIADRLRRELPIGDTLQIEVVT